MFSKVVGLMNIKMLQPTILEFMSPTRVTYSKVAAAGVISSLPVVSLAVALQRYVMAGIMKGAVK